MALTDGLKLPIPELTEAADGPDAFSDLANAVEDFVYDRTLPSGVTRYPLYHWGTGTSLPASNSGVRAGDTYFYTGIGLLTWTGTAWGSPADRTIGGNFFTPGGQKLLTGTPGWTDLITITGACGAGPYQAMWDGTAFNGGSGADRSMSYRVVCDGVSAGGDSGITIPLTGQPRIRRQGIQEATPGVGGHTWILQANASIASAVYVEMASFRVIERRPA